MCILLFDHVGVNQEELGLMQPTGEAVDSPEHYQSVDAHICFDLEDKPQRLLNALRDLLTVSWMIYEIIVHMHGAICTCSYMLLYCYSYLCTPIACLHIRIIFCYIYSCSHALQ